MQFPRKGFAVCDLHGGKTPNAVRGAAERQQAAVLAELVVKHAVPIDRPPAEGIRIQLAVRAGEVEWLRALVHHLDPDGMWRGTLGIHRTEKTGFEAGVSTTTDVGPALPIVYQAYMAAQKAYEDLCKDALKLGMTWEQIKLDQRFGARVAEAFTFLFGQVREVLADLGTYVPAEVMADVLVRLQGRFAGTLRILAASQEFPAISA
jgi:hypothetical protein